VIRAAAAGPLAGTDPAARRILEASVASLASMRMPIARGSEHSWRAALHALDGDRDRALEANARALEAATEVNMPWQQRMIDIQRAWIAEEDPTEPLARLAAMGMADPAKVTALYAWAPGGPGPTE
jgi:ATP/maltotriose-dependent transcriptional regulator MalT